MRFGLMICCCGLVAGWGCAPQGQLVPPPQMASQTPPPGAAPPSSPGWVSPQVAAQQRQLQQDAGALNFSNEQLHAQVAQMQRALAARTDELNNMRAQMQANSQLLTRLRTEKEQADEQVRSMTASMQRKVGATITANSSLRETLPQVAIPGVEVRRDGDVIRVELPADQLFQPDSYQPLPGASNLVDRVAGEVKRAWPNQVIGVEGHTDSEPVRGGQVVHNHQMSVIQSLAVFDMLVSRGHFPADQLTLTGHGANYPVVSNATPAGKLRNRRVELVIYPETYKRS